LQTNLYYQYWACAVVLGQVCEYDEVLATPIAGILDTELEGVGKGVTASDPANNRSAAFVHPEIGVVVAGTYFPQAAPPMRSAA
jgi:hypothetical protein